MAGVISATVARVEPLSRYRGFQAFNDCKSGARSPFLTPQVTSCAVVVNNSRRIHLLSRPSLLSLVSPLRRIPRTAP